MKDRILLALLCCFLACTAAAQRNREYQLPESDQRNIQAAAVDKVNRFQKNCSLIADTGKSRAMKDSYIKSAMQDFMEGAQIIITNMNGTAQPKKPVKRYLERLSLLDKRYAVIEITWSDCYITDEFKYDANTGMYVGWAKVKQQFRANAREIGDISDVVERTVKVYAKLTKVYERDRIRKRWVVSLGDISARTIL